MGDAAHATLPYLAQGANMAIEDAAILGRMLDEFNTLPVQERLNKYESARFERTKRIVEESTSSGKLYQQPSEEDLRTAFAARDLAGERNEWLYSYDPLTVPLS